MYEVVQNWQMTNKQKRRNLSNYVCGITDKSPGNINGKGQLVCLHPGSKQAWDCYRCNEQLATNKLFEGHCKIGHGYSNETSKSTGTHMRYCQGIPPAEHQLKFECYLCKFSSGSNSGLQVHISVAHKNFHNEKRKEKEKNFKWTEPEFKYLARTIIELKKDKVRNVSKTAGQKLGRTQQAIQKIRTGTEYKRAERKVKEEIAKVLNQRTDEESYNIEVVARESTDELIIAEIKQDSEHDLEQGQEQVRETEIYNQVSSSVFWCKTPMRTVRRQLPIVTPTPIHQSMVAMLERLVQQETLMIQNTPKESRRLPSVPTVEATKGTKQMPKGTLQSNTEMTETPPVNITDKHSTPIVNIRRPAGRRVLHERDPDCKQTTCRWQELW